MIPINKLLQVQDMGGAIGRLTMLFCHAKADNENLSVVRSRGVTVFHRLLYEINDFNPCRPELLTIISRVVALQGWDSTVLLNSI